MSTETLNSVLGIEKFLETASFMREHTCAPISGLTPIASRVLSWFYNNQRDTCEGSKVREM